MQRRKFVTLFPATGALLYSFPEIKTAKRKKDSIQYDTREYWIQVLRRIADPVLLNLSQEKLRANMPVECLNGLEKDRLKFSHLEAFGRLIAGMAPWLELGYDSSDEGKIRAQYINLTKTCLSVIANPASPDFMNFEVGMQPLVDAAFLAHGLLRGYTNLWESLDSMTKQNIIHAMQATRKIKPYYSNWLLFSAMIEVFFLKAGYDYDPVRIDYALKKHLEWYKGDGIYGDGPDFHWDYYNSFVIHPMLLDIAKVLIDYEKEPPELYSVILKRAKRYAVIQERLISPDGTFPPIGRSLTYRFGAFQLLGQVALLNELPDDITPAQVRSALSAVISRMIEASGTFDENGWLTIGFCGHQPSLAESYISTGSLYLCTTGLLPLGLSAGHPFWTMPSEDWTQRKLWGGKDFTPDKAL